MVSAPIRRKREGLLPFVKLLVDVVVIQLILWLSYWLRFLGPFFETPLGVPDVSVYASSFNFITIVTLFFLRFFDLYKAAHQHTFYEETMRVVKAVACSFIMLTALSFFIRSGSYSRTLLVFTGVLLAAGLALARFGFALAVMVIDKRRGSHRNILFLGHDTHTAKLASFYSKNPRFSTKVMGILDDRLEPGTSVGGVPVMGRLEELPKYLQPFYQVHEVVLAVPNLPSEAVLKIIYECEKELVSFRWIADFFGLITSKMDVSYLGGVPVLSFVDSPLRDWENRILKRAMDVVLSTSALIILSPLFLLIAFLVRKDSPGPIFYGQQRIGEDGRRFLLLKFRTMKTDAEAETGPVWAMENDPRRTRIGGILRKTNLDELPQIWNVLKGDMSLVGPRPERPFFVSQFREEIPRYMARHSIRSGITGWAQVNGLRGNTSIEERTEFDLYYIEHWSLLFDAKILFMTLFANRNAY